MPSASRQASVCPANGWPFTCNRNPLTPAPVSVADAAATWPPRRLPEANSDPARPNRGRARSSRRRARRLTRRRAGRPREQPESLRQRSRAAKPRVGAPDHLNLARSLEGVANGRQRPLGPRRSSGTLPPPAAPAALTLSLRITVPGGAGTIQAPQRPPRVAVRLLTESPSPPTAQAARDTKRGELRAKAASAWPAPRPGLQSAARYAPPCAGAAATSARDTAAQQMALIGLSRLTGRPPRRTRCWPRDAWQPWLSVGRISARIRTPPGRQADGRPSRSAAKAAGRGRAPGRRGARQEPARAGLARRRRRPRGEKAQPQKRTVARARRAGLDRAGARRRRIDRERACPDAGASFPGGCAVDRLPRAGRHAGMAGRSAARAAAPGRCRAPGRVARDGEAGSATRAGGRLRRCPPPSTWPASASGSAPCSPSPCTTPAAAAAPRPAALRPL